jgi:putative methionine-R-sulfoxide reductase with GAF domain
MPSEGPIVSGDQSVEDLRRELAEGREQHAAAAEILRVIASSPMDLQVVFAAIAASAARLCDAYDAAIHRVDGDVLPVVAHHGPIPIRTLPLRAGFFVGCAVLDQRTIHISDVQTAADEYPEGSDLAKGLGFRTILAVPLIRAGKAIGVISIRRVDVRAFTDRQVELLKTFADQAVIAIENARLFEEVQARTRDLTESLEQQTATADVLKAISRSALDLQRVLDALVESAARLCNAYDAVIFQVFGDGVRLVAHYGQIPMAGPVGQLSRPLVRGFIAGRAVIERRTIQVADITVSQTRGPARPARAFVRGSPAGVPRRSAPRMHLVRRPLSSRRTCRSLCQGVPAHGWRDVAVVLVLTRWVAPGVKHGLRLHRSIDVLDQLSNDPSLSHGGRQCRNGKR